jgi:hypothetical protein
VHFEFDLFLQTPSSAAAFMLVCRRMPPRLSSLPLAGQAAMSSGLPARFTSRLDEEL